MNKVAKITPEIINALVINEMIEYDDYIAMQLIDYLIKEIDSPDKKLCDRGINELKEQIYQIEELMFLHINNYLLENINLWSGNGLRSRRTSPMRTMNYENYPEAIEDVLKNEGVLKLKKINNKLSCKLYEHFISNDDKLIIDNIEYFHNSSLLFFYSKNKGVDYTDEETKSSIKNNLNRMYFIKNIFKEHSKEELYIKCIDYILDNEKLLQIYDKDWLIEAKTYVEKEIITNQIESIKNDTPTKRRRI